MTIRSHSIAISSGTRNLVSADSFSFAENSITFLFGESGIGKSLICKALYGLLKTSDLKVSIDGKSYKNYLESEWVKNAAQNGFFVFQEPSSHLNPLMKIREQISEGSLALADNQNEVLARLWENSDERSIRKILDLYPKPYRPSGGEKQRILLAMAFKKIGLYQKMAGNAMFPGFFVFDEPTGSLDNNYRNLFLSLLIEKFCARPFTAIIITHDYSVISEIYRNYSSLLENIHFRELSHTGGGKVALEEFSASRYLGWLDTERSTVSSVKISGQPVLFMQPFFRVFGRSLCIFRDSARTVPAELVIRQGEITYVKAPSGMGKTTLAKLIMGLYSAEKAEFVLCENKITEKTPPDFWRKQLWGKLASMAFQHADEALDQECTVIETFRGLPGQRNSMNVSGLLSGLFDSGTISKISGKKIKYLSGGQKQRLNLLRTFILNAALTILDEPLNALDFDSMMKVLNLLDAKREDGCAFLMISHNEEIFDAIIPQSSIYYLGETENAE